MSALNSRRRACILAISSFVGFCGLVAIPSLVGVNADTADGSFGLGAAFLGFGGVATATIVAMGGGATLAMGSSGT